MVLSFPACLLLLPAAVLLGVVYVTLGWRFGGRGRSVGRDVGRALVLGATWSAPLFIAGPGPAKLTLGLLVGFVGIRMVALGERWRTADPPPSAGRILVSMLSLEDLFVRLPANPTRAPSREASLGTATGGLLGVAGCIALVFAGSRWQIWRVCWPADDLLVLVEVAIGAAGIHRLIVGGAALAGRNVAGLQDRPLRSASLSEFWGRRWNRLVQANLNRAFFRPRSRSRHPRRGILAAFTASGIMHVIAVADAAHLRETWRPALAVMAFFWLHAAGILVERSRGTQAFRLNAPPPPHPGLVARARTVVVLALLSPLLLEPFAAVVHLHGRPGPVHSLDQNFRLTPTVP